MARIDDVAQYPIDGILIKNAKIAIGREVALQRFQLEAKFVGAVTDGDRSKIRQACLGTNGSEFGHGDGDVVPGKLIWPALNAGEFCIDA